MATTTFDSSLITGAMDASQIDEKVILLQDAVRSLWNVQADKAYDTPFEWDYATAYGTADNESLKVIKLKDDGTSGDPYLELYDAVNDNTWRLSIEKAYDPGSGSIGDVFLLKLDVASVWTDIMAISSSDIWHKTLGLLSLAGTTSGVTSLTAGTGLTTDLASGDITVGIDALGVDTASIAAGAVTKAKLDSDSVDDDKITSEKAAGGNATTGYVITADGSGGAAWEANAAGGVAEVVSTQTEGGLSVLNVSDGTGTADVALLTFDGDTHIKSGSLTGSSRLVTNSVSLNKITRPAAGTNYLLRSADGGVAEWIDETSVVTSGSPSGAEVAHFYTTYNLKGTPINYYTFLTADVTDLTWSLGLNNVDGYIVSGRPTMPISTGTYFASLGVSSNPTMTASTYDQRAKIGFGTLNTAKDALGGTAPLSFLRYVGQTVLSAGSPALAGTLNASSNDIFKNDGSVSSIDFGGTISHNYYDTGVEEDRYFTLNMIVYKVA